MGKGPPRPARPAVFSDDPPAPRSPEAPTPPPGEEREEVYVGHVPLQEEWPNNNQNKPGDDFLTDDMPDLKEGPGLGTSPLASRIPRNANGQCL
eukprot:18638-Pyramimonas_sp.AAC.1